MGGVLLLLLLLLILILILRLVLPRFFPHFFFSSHSFLPPQGFVRANENRRPKGILLGEGSSVDDKRLDVLLRVPVGNSSRGGVQRSAQRHNNAGYLSLREKSYYMYLLYIVLTTFTLTIHR